MRPRGAGGLLLVAVEHGADLLELEGAPTGDGLGRVPGQEETCRDRGGLRWGSLTTFECDFHLQPRDWLERFD
jgi:hypothetical protein